MNYFVALHEIGHIIIGLEPTRLEREALAWEWAYEHAIVDPHFSTRQRVCACLWRYVCRAENHGWPTPDADHVFWRLMKWWK